MRLSYVISILFLFVVALGACAAVDSGINVDPGTVAVVTRFGEVTGEVFHPGLNWKTPFIEDVLRYPTARRSYETSNNPDTSRANFTDFPTDSKTNDGQEVVMTFTVLFAIRPECAPVVAQEIGDLNAVVENVVKANSRNLARQNTFNYGANEMFSGDGVVNYEAETEEELRQAMGLACVDLIDFLVRKPQFEEKYEDTIEDQQIAEERIKTEQFNAEAAEFVKQQAIRAAEAEAQSKVLDAEAEAQARVLQAEAEAQAIELQGQALRRNPEVIEWQFVQNLTGVNWGILPADSVTPFLPVGPEGVGP